jgi:hypothetical protein
MITPEQVIVISQGIGFGLFFAFWVFVGYDVFMKESDSKVTKHIKKIIC